MRRLSRIPALLGSPPPALASMPIDAKDRDQKRAEFHPWRALYKTKRWVQLGHARPRHVHVPDVREGKAHKSEMIVVTVVAAFQLAIGELEKLDPENKVLKQAPAMMAIAMTSDFGMDRSIMRLSAVTSAPQTS